MAAASQQWQQSQQGPQSTPSLGAPAANAASMLVGQTRDALAAIVTQVHESARVLESQHPAGQPSPIFGRLEASPFPGLAGTV
eukprot:7931923-Alexandrium_andersonii.AAC.1